MCSVQCLLIADFLGNKKEAFQWKKRLPQYPLQTVQAEWVS